jgi:hypothetical protein
MEWKQEQASEVSEPAAGKFAIPQQRNAAGPSQQCAAEFLPGRVAHSASATESGLTFGPALNSESSAPDKREFDDPAPECKFAGASRIWQALSIACTRLWGSLEARRATQRRRSLRVVESVAMGEKRFVAIVQVEQARFLVGGGTAGVSLLARLDAVEDFAAVLSQQTAGQAEPALASNLKVAR